MRYKSIKRVNKAIKELAGAMKDLTDEVEDLKDVTAAKELWEITCEFKPVALRIVDFQTRVAERRLSNLYPITGGKKEVDKVNGAR